MYELEYAMDMLTLHKIVGAERCSRTIYLLSILVSPLFVFSAMTCLEFLKGRAPARMLLHGWHGQASGFMRELQLDPSCI